MKAKITGVKLGPSETMKDGKVNIQLDMQNHAQGEELTYEEAQAKRLKEIKARRKDDLAEDYLILLDRLEEQGKILRNAHNLNARHEEKIVELRIDVKDVKERRDRYNEMHNRNTIAVNCINETMQELQKNTKENEYEPKDYFGLYHHLFGAVNQFQKSYERHC